ncbi:ferritin [Puniceicoccus vermicola]|uniref:Ferritin n=1 Tax=Puniceicoccus vermicola TaxID=388746 RepID=A0A7X1AV51_9BACT|nr:ferritin [Puniceicoccus vermicola]MBC2600507.1 ferritin [Puniceicoccus vermicola]
MSETQKSDLPALLCRQVNHEFYAALSYEALAVWCADNEFNGFAEFFRKQASEEGEHARKFIAHMSERSMKPEIGGMEPPRTEFDSLLEVALFARGLELKNTQLIIECYDEANASGNPRSVPFLLNFIEEQVEEEAWAATMVGLLEKCDCPGSLLNLDRHIIQTLG